MFNESQDLNSLDSEMIDTLSVRHDEYMIATIDRGYIEITMIIQ